MAETLPTTARNVSWSQRLRPSLRSNLPFVVAVALYVAGSIIAANAFGFSIDLQLYDGFTYVIVPFLCFLWLVAATLIALIRDRPARPVLHLWNIVVQRGDWQISRRLAYALPVILIAPTFFAAFTSMKVSLSLIVPFYADPWAARLDRLVHGGDAWALLQPILGFPIVTAAIDFFYGLWLFVAYTVLFTATFMLTRDRLRARYLLAYVLCWSLLGTVAATALASVGPCFYGLFYGEDPFAAQMAYLRDAANSFPIVTVATQRLLAENHAAGQIGAGLGISAMPSLHVAVAFLNVLFAWNFGRVWRWLATTFFVFILLGSVHLGWHYAVDGYVSIAAVIALWWASSAIVGLLYSEEPSR